MTPGAAVDAPVTVVEAPADIDPITITTRLHRDHGWATVVTAPGAATAINLNHGILRCITDAADHHPLPQTEEVTIDRYTAAWTTGWGITDVALFGAAQATPTQKSRLHQWANHRNVRLHVIVDHGHTRHVTGAAHNTATLPWHDWANTLPTAPANPAPAPDTYTAAATDTYLTYRAASHGRTTLPHVNWPTFLHTCRQTLPPDQYRRVWAQYTDAYTRAARTPRSDLFVRILLDETVLQPSNTTDELITRLRGAQAGLFTNNVTVTVNTDRLTTNFHRIAHPTYTDAHWAALRRYLQPTRSTTAALYMHGIQPVDLTTVTCVEITDTHQTGTFRGRDLDPRTRPHLAALNTYHQHKRSTPDATALSGNAHHISGWLNEARTLYGLPFGMSKQLPNLEGLNSIANYIQLRIHFIGGTKLGRTEYS